MYFVISLLGTYYMGWLTNVQLKFTCASWLFSRLSSPRPEAITILVEGHPYYVPAALINITSDVNALVVSRYFLILRKCFREREFGHLVSLTFNL